MDISKCFSQSLSRMQRSHLITIGVWSKITSNRLKGYKSWMVWKVLKDVWVAVRNWWRCDVSASRFQGLIDFKASCYEHASSDDLIRWSQRSESLVWGYWHSRNWYDWYERTHWSSNLERNQNGCQLAQQYGIWTWLLWQQTNQL